MTRKDYEMIADAVRPVAEGSADAGSKVAVAVASAIAENLAQALAHDNPRFDKARFLKACGVAA